MYIQAYCSIQFLETIIKKNPADIISPENSLSGKTHFELLDLIAKGLNIKTDCNAQKLEENYANPYIKHLIKNNRISCAEKEFADMRINEKLFFQKANIATCLYLLTNCDAMIKDYSDKTGNYFFTASSKLDCLFEERLQTFSTKDHFSWDFAKNYFEPHNSIVFADPYLFKEDSRQSIEKLLDIILPKKLIGKYHITLIGTDNNKANGLPNKATIEQWVKSIANKLSRSIETVIEYHIYDKEDFHDRTIITNNACIFSGIGLNMIKKDTSQKDTTWVGFKPFKRVNTNNNNSVLVYNIMKEKLATMKTWIAKSEQKTTQNPLFY